MLFRAPEASTSTAPAPSPAPPANAPAAAPPTPAATAPAPAASAPAPAPPAADAPPAAAAVPAPTNPLDALSQAELRKQLDGARKDLRGQLEKKKRIDRDLVSCGRWLGRVRVCCSEEGGI